MDSIHRIVTSFKYFVLCRAIVPHHSQLASQTAGLRRKPYHSTPVRQARTASPEPPVPLSPAACSSCPSDWRWGALSPACRKRATRPKRFCRLRALSARSVQRSRPTSGLG